MTSAVPTLKECLRASSRLPLQLTRTKRGTPSARVYLFQLIASLLRGGHRTTGSTSPAHAGALLIAAEQSVRDVNAALLRASVVLEDYIDLPEAPSFSEVVADRALLLLRAGWRRRDNDIARDIAEHGALTAHLVWWSEGAD